MEESNLPLRFWRPPCYRYTNPPEERILACCAKSVRLTGESLAATTIRPRPEPLRPVGYAAVTGTSRRPQDPHCRTEQHAQASAGRVFWRLPPSGSTPVAAELPALTIGRLGPSGLNSSRALRACPTASSTVLLPLWWSNRHSRQTGRSIDRRPTMPLLPPEPTRSERLLRWLLFELCCSSPI
jgi:hypothetical protein